MGHKNCSRCNAGMPAQRVNHLCEECFAEEIGSDCDDDLDYGDEDDEPVGSCENCDSNVYADEAGDDGLCDQCRWWANQ